MIERTQCAIHILQISQIRKQVTQTYDDNSLEFVAPQCPSVLLVLHRTVSSHTGPCDYSGNVGHSVKLFFVFLPTLVAQLKGNVLDQFLKSLGNRLHSAQARLSSFEPFRNVLLARQSDIFVVSISLIRFKVLSNSLSYLS